MKKVLPIAVVLAALSTSALACGWSKSQTVEAPEPETKTEAPSA